MSKTQMALITGASAGLGREFAEQLAAAGHSLVLVARRKEKLEKAAFELRSAHKVRVITIAADLSDPDSPDRIAAELSAAGIEINYLINNAGALGCDLLEDRDWPSQQQFFELMMISAAHLCHLFIPKMRANGFGHVINVASVAGRLPQAGGCNYGPSKAYLIALSEDLSLTLYGSGVNVCAFCPGFVHTDFHETAGLQDSKNAMPKWVWYDAKTVVKEGINAVAKGRPVYLSGRLYRWIDPLLQSLITRRFFRIKPKT